MDLERGAAGPGGDRALPELRRRPARPAARHPVRDRRRRRWRSTRDQHAGDLDTADGEPVRGTVRHRRHRHPLVADRPRHRRHGVVRRRLALQQPLPARGLRLHAASGSAIIGTGSTGVQATPVVARAGRPPLRVPAVGGVHDAGRTPGRTSPASSTSCGSRYDEIRAAAARVLHRCRPAQRLLRADRGGGAAAAEGRDPRGAAPSDRRAGGRRRAAVGRRAVRHRGEPHGHGAVRRGRRPHRAGPRDGRVAGARTTRSPASGRSSTTATTRRSTATTSPWSTSSKGAITARDAHGHRHRAGRLRARRDPLRHRLRRHHRRAQPHGHPRPRTGSTSASVWTEEGPLSYLGLQVAGLPEPVHDPGPGQPVGDRRTSSPRSSSTSSGSASASTYLQRQRLPHDRGAARRHRREWADARRVDGRGQHRPRSVLQLLVQRRQRAGEAPRVPGLPRAASPSTGAAATRSPPPATPASSWAERADAVPASSTTSACSSPTRARATSRCCSSTATRPTPTTGAGRSRTSRRTTASSRSTSAATARPAPRPTATRPRSSPRTSSPCSTTSASPRSWRSATRWAAASSARSPSSTPSASPRSWRSIPPTCVDDEVAGGHRPAARGGSTTTGRRAVRAGRSSATAWRRRAATSALRTWQVRRVATVEPHVLRARAAGPGLGHGAALGERALPAAPPACPVLSFHADPARGALEEPLFGDERSRTVGWPGGRATGCTRSGPAELNAIVAEWLTTL